MPAALNGKEVAILVNQFTNLFQMCGLAHSPINKKLTNIGSAQNMIEAGTPVWSKPV
jgi:hypothetical protein